MANKSDSRYRTGRVGPLGGTGARADGQIDEGLRSYMVRVYNYMAIGLVITAVAAVGTANLTATTAADGSVMLNSLGVAFYTSPLRWIVVLAPLGIVFFLSFRIATMSVSAAQTTFWLFSALMGISLSSIFLFYTSASIVQVFAITAATFAALSLFGYTTRRDISGWGSFLIMGLFGIVIAMIVNIFLNSSALQFAVSVIGVLVFSGLTAYHTQKIKEMYYVGDDGTVTGRKAIIGALQLYLDFINLFVMLLRLFGGRQ